jgi:hypothetical protein
MLISYSRAANMTAEFWNFFVSYYLSDIIKSLFQALIVVIVTATDTEHMIE